MAGFRIEGNVSGNVVEVDADNQAKVVTNTDPAKAGSIRIFSENDPGDVIGTPYCLSPETSDDYRLRVGVDCVLDHETFNYTNQNTGKHNYNATTLTAAITGGFLTTNSGSVTTTTTGLRFLTQRYFPLLGQQTPLYIETSGSFSAALSGTTNTTIDWGIGITPNTNPYAPTDGVYFRATSAGVRGVINYNTVETQTAIFTFTPAIGRVYQFLIVCNEREIEFWIDDVLYGRLETQTGNGQPMMASSAPYFIRHAIVGGAAGNTQQFKVSDYSVFLGDLAINKPWSHQLVGMGNTLQVQQGATTGGQLTTYANGAWPAAVTLTASTAPATNTLGGLFTLPTTITTADSDYPLFAWQNPAGTTAIPGKTFYVTSIIVAELAVHTALTGGPLICTYGVGWGSTGSALTTTESTTFTAGGTTKVARRLPLGVQALAATAAAGTVAQGFQRQFDPPLPINPGEYLHIILRVNGTNLTAGVPRGGITVNGYFE